MVLSQSTNRPFPTCIAGFRMVLSLINPLLFRSNLDNWAPSIYFKGIPALSTKNQHTY